MSGRSCKAAICLSAASAASEMTCEIAEKDIHLPPGQQTYTPKQQEELAEAADKYTKRLVEIQENP